MDANNRIPHQFELGSRRFGHLPTGRGDLRLLVLVTWGFVVLLLVGIGIPHWRPGTPGPGPGPAGWVAGCILHMALSGRLNSNSNY